MRFVNKTHLSSSDCCHLYMCLRVSCNLSALILLKGSLHLWTSTAYCIVHTCRVDSFSKNTHFIALSHPYTTIDVAQYTWIMLVSMQTRCKVSSRPVWPPYSRVMQPLKNIKIDGRIKTTMEIRIDIASACIWFILIFQHPAPLVTHVGKSLISLLLGSFWCHIPANRPQYQKHLRPSPSNQYTEILMFLYPRVLSPPQLHHPLLSKFILQIISSLGDCSTQFK